MNESEIAKKFLENGFQLDVSAMKYLSEHLDAIEAVINKITSSGTRGTFVTMEIINEILPKAVPFNIIKPSQATHKKISIENHTGMLVKRFNTLKDILSKRMELVNQISINKITPRTRKFSLVVMVKDKAPSYIIVEDLTGETTIGLSLIEEKESGIIEQDDIMGVVCETTDNGIEAKSIIWPGIPLKRKLQSTSTNDYFLFSSEKVSSNKIEELGKDCTNLTCFVVGEQSKFIENGKEYAIPAPSILESHGMLFYISNKCTEATPTNSIVNLIKKRHMSPAIDVKNIEDDFLLDIIPDIFVVGGCEEVVQNYKGVTIISIGKSAWLLKAKTRETIKIDFK